jgi:hypothetical protein
MHAARIQERAVLLIRLEDMRLQPRLQKKQKLNRNSRLGGAMFLEKGHHLVAKHLVLNPVSRQSGKFVPLHQRFLGGEVQPGVGHQSVENLIDGSVALSNAQRTLEPIHDIEQFLMLLIENGDVYPVCICPAEYARHM